MSNGPSDPHLWVAVDRYIAESIVPSDAALAASDAAGLPAIHVAPNQSKFLALLATLRGALRVLGTGNDGFTLAVVNSR